MRAGELRHPITIQQNTVSRTASGAVTDSWGSFASAFGAMKTIGGGEPAEDRSSVTQKLVEWKIRYLPGISTAMRVLFGSRTFDILSINDVEERGREMILQCKEGLSRGN